MQPMLQNNNKGAQCSSTFKMTFFRSLKLNGFVKGLIRPWLIKFDAWNDARSFEKRRIRRQLADAEANVVAEAKVAKATAAFNDASFPAVTLECERESLCMGDDCNAPNSKTLLVSSSLTDPVALGQMLGSDYLPSTRNTGPGLTWELQLNSVKFARLTYASDDTPVAEPLVTKCELLLDGPNAVYCTRIYRIPGLRQPRSVRDVVVPADPPLAH